MYPQSGRSCESVSEVYFGEKVEQRPGVYYKGETVRVYFIRFARGDFLIDLVM